MRTRPALFSGHKRGGFVYCSDLLVASIRAIIDAKEVIKNQIKLLRLFDTCIYSHENFSVYEKYD